MTMSEAWKRRGWSASWSVLLCALSGCLAGPIDVADLETDVADSAQTDGASTPLLLETRGGDLVWRTGIVPYCFVPPVWQLAPGDVQAATGSPDAFLGMWRARMDQFNKAIAATWASENLVRFVVTACGPGVVPIHFDLNEAGMAGRAAQGPVFATGDYGMRLAAYYLADTAPRDFAWVVAHEMGHVLGFEHEQDQRGATCPLGVDSTSSGLALTVYDPESVMNYCATRQQLLTPQDRAGFRAAYGFAAQLNGTQPLPPQQPNPKAPCNPSQDIAAKTPGPSSTDGTPMTFDLQNHCPAATVAVLWVDFNGTEISYGNIQRGQEFHIQSFSGHKWRVRNAVTGRLLREAIVGQEAAAVSVPR